MLKYIVKRILLAIPVLLGVSVIVFLIMRVFSADPAPVVLGQHATAEAMDQWREANGLNDPLIVQYFNFLAGALTGNLGESYYTHTPVTQELLSRFPATVELALVAIIIAAVIGVVLGVISATHKNSPIDGSPRSSHSWASRCRFSGWACCSLSSLPACSTCCRARAASTRSSSRWRHGLLSPRHPAHGRFRGL